MQVVDASVLIEALTSKDRKAHAAWAVVRAGALAAPEMIDVEVVSSLRGLVRGGVAGVLQAREALVTMRSLPLLRYPHLPLLPRIWQLRDNLTAYDASYVALAEALGCALVTADKRLARTSGARCEIVVSGA